jgi:hypothetical protein
MPWTIASHRRRKTKAKSTEGVEGYNVKALKPSTQLRCNAPLHCERAKGAAFIASLGNPEIFRS